MTGRVRRIHSHRSLPVRARDGRSELFIGNGKGEPPPRPNAPTDAFPANASCAAPTRLADPEQPPPASPCPIARGAWRDDHARAAGERPRGRARRAPVRGPVADHACHLRHQGEPHVRPGVRRPRGVRRRHAGRRRCLAGDLRGGEAARRPGGPPQDITPNHRALALRFGLFDRFFVNSEASPDGHNWSTAAFSTDYVDKAFRWSYSGRGRSTTTRASTARPTSTGASCLRGCSCRHRRRPRGVHEALRSVPEWLPRRRGARFAVSLGRGRARGAVATAPTASSSARSRQTT